MRYIVILKPKRMDLLWFDASKYEIAYCIMLYDIVQKYLIVNTQIKRMNYFWKMKVCCRHWDTDEHLKKSIKVQPYFCSNHNFPILFPFEIQWLTEWTDRFGSMFNDLWFQMWNFPSRWEMSFDASRLEWMAKIWYIRKMRIWNGHWFYIMYYYKFNERPMWIDLVLNQSVIQCNVKSWMMYFRIYLECNVYINIISYYSYKNWNISFNSKNKFVMQNANWDCVPGVCWSETTCNV